MKPAKEWDAYYGVGVIREQSARLEDYVVLTSPSAWKAVQPHMVHEPKAVEYITNQEFDDTEALAARLPETSMSVGVGGGKALDAAKIVADRIGSDLAFIPTIVSTGAIFQPHFPGRRNGMLEIVHLDRAPEFVLFETDVIGSAPPYMNAAGMGECVCWVGNMASWQWWSENGHPDCSPYDESVANQVVEWARSRVSRYSANLNDDGRPGEDAIRVCAEVSRERYDLPTQKLKAPAGLDHLFDSAFVRLHRRDLFHGEAVALGTLITCHLYGRRFEEVKGMLDACGTRYRPSEIGCTWDEARGVLDLLPRHSADIGWHKTIFEKEPLTDEVFREMSARIDEPA
jgi:glycerol dehydrogenase-like iron-containing ADH family enzyme